MRALVGTCARGVVLLVGAALITAASATASAPRPQVGALRATQTIIPASGGTTKVSANVWNASTCLWSGEWEGTSITENSPPVNCGASFEATDSDTVTLPANGSDASRTWIVYLIAKGPGGTSRYGHIDLTQQGLSSATTTTTTTTTTTPTSATSQNWSGYIVPSSSALITEVSGEWTVPTLTCSDTPTGGVSVWVGIGGEQWPTGGTSGELLQTGVTSECVNGLQQDAGWFELYPSIPNREEDFADFSVSPGDSIKASVYQATDGDFWVTRVDDLTTGMSGEMVTGVGWGVLADTSNSFTEQGSTAGVSYSGGYTAEWIVEDYEQGSLLESPSQVPLADYGTVTFTNLTTSLSSWSLTPAESIAIFQNGAVVSQPSSPSSDGFSVSYAGP